MNILSRRNFVRTFALSLVVFPVARQLLAVAWASETKKSGDLPAGQAAVSETDIVASAVGYHRNVKDIDYSKFPQRKKPEAKNQFCKSCVNFTAVNDGWGKCLILTSGLVSSTGWCGSWTKNPKVVEKS